MSVRSRNPELFCEKVLKRGSSNSCPKIKQIFQRGGSLLQAPVPCCVLPLCPQQGPLPLPTPQRASSGLHRASHRSCRSPSPPTAQRPAPRCRGGLRAFPLPSTLHALGVLLVWRELRNANSKGLDTRTQIQLPTTIIFNLSKTVIQ